MNKTYPSLGFDLFSVYVVLKYASVILDIKLSSCDPCENEFSYAKKPPKPILNDFVNDYVSPGSSSSKHWTE